MQLQRADLVEQVYQRIKDAILQGALEPLAPLRQEELAEMLGVSRQPVSHALMLLEHDGLLVDHVEIRKNLKGGKKKTWHP